MNTTHADSISPRSSILPLIARWAGHASLVGLSAVLWALTTSVAVERDGTTSAGMERDPAPLCDTAGAAPCVEGAVQR